MSSLSALRFLWPSLAVALLCFVVSLSSYQRNHTDQLCRDKPEGCAEGTPIVLDLDMPEAGACYKTPDDAGKYQSNAILSGPGDPKLEVSHGCLSAAIDVTNNAQITVSKHPDQVCGSTLPDFPPFDMVSGGRLSVPSNLPH